jgi:hypothetical protein
MIEKPECRARCTVEDIKKWMVKKERRENVDSIYVV